MTEAAKCTSANTNFASSSASCARQLIRLIGVAAIAALPINGASAAMSINTGNLFEQMTDYEPDGTDRLAFIRYYNSLGIQSYGPTAPLGIQWRWNYDSDLVLVPNSPYVMAEQADGRVVHFNIGNGVGAPNSDVDLTLVQVGEDWVLTNRDGTVDRYGPPDSEGRSRLLATETADGYKQTLSYNDAGQVISVTDSRGKTLSFAYEGNSLITVTTPEGAILTYGYNSSLPGLRNDRLVSVSYSSSPDKDRTYLYENPKFANLLTGILDTKGKRLATWTYDGFGRATSSQLADGANLTTISYDIDSKGNPVNTVTNARGEHTVYKMTIMQDVPKVTEIDRPATPAAPALTEWFTYDDRGYPVKKTDSNGQVINYHPRTLSESP